MVFQAPPSARRLLVELNNTAKGPFTAANVHAACSFRQHVPTHVRVCPRVHVWSHYNLELWSQLEGVWSQNTLERSMRCSILHFSYLSSLWSWLWVRLKLALPSVLPVNWLQHQKNVEEDHIPAFCSEAACRSIISYHLSSHSPTHHPSIHLMYLLTK